MGRILFNDVATRMTVGTEPTRSPLRFHQRLPDYRPTPILRLPRLARRLGVEQVLLKDESNRLGLQAFKILGASWAVYSAACRLCGSEPSNSADVADLRAHFAPLRPLELITATDGNHGRAVARVARLFGFGARVFVPKGTAPARIAGIESEGASVVVVDGTYDETVARAAATRSDRSMLIQDTSWPGYEEVPAWVIEGYSTMFWEIDDALSSASEHGPDVVVVQVGVGALASAVVAHYRRTVVEPKPRILTVEPVGAACALAAMEADRIVTVPGEQDSIMAGLNCGTLASIVWPVLRAGVDGFISLDDDVAQRAMRELATEGIISGESGAAGVAALLYLADRPDADSVRRRSGLSADCRVLVISTEGATDPASYNRIISREGTRYSAFGESVALNTSLLSGQTHTRTLHLNRACSRPNFPLSATRIQV